MRRKWIFMAPLGILGMLLFIAIGGQVVLHLWNWLLPSLFGWSEITFWKALGILALCRILFGGFGFRGSGRCNCRRRKDQQFTPEERERLRQGMRTSTGEGQGL